MSSAPISSASSAYAPEFLRDGPASAPATVVLAHGAGQGMDSAFMDRIAAGLATAGLATVRFEFPYMQAARTQGKRKAPDRTPTLTAAWVQVIEHLAADGVAHEQLFIGGKSMGGRMASLVADDAGVAGLVCLGYPFHPPGKPDRLRTAHLETLTTPALICQGERDTFGTREEVGSYRLSDTIGVHWLADGDHSFKPRKRSGVTEAQNIDSAIAAVVAFVNEHRPSSTSTA